MATFPEQIDRDNYERLGWTDGRLGIAFDLIDEVLSATHEEHDAHAMLKKARDLCEDADCELERRS